MRQRSGYDVDGLLRWLQEPNHAHRTGGDPRHYRSYLDYDSFHRLGRESAPKSAEHNPGERLWTSVAFDTSMDRLTRSEEAPRDPASADPDQRAWRVSELAYDGAGRLRRVTLPKGVATGGNPDDFVTQYEYDPLDRVVTEVRFDGQGGARRAHACYDAAGDLRWLTAPKAGLTSASTACATGGQPPSHTTRIEYDAAHRPLAETDAEGRRSQLAFDANGQVESETDELGVKVVRTYDERGNLVKIVQPLERNGSGQVLDEATRTGRRVRSSIARTGR